ncbi:MAG TPA: M64 family metallopeptidase [Bacteroidales bacterium]|nr:M64 family metallopeptidase [Bacteroidales bacterium]
MIRALCIMMAVMLLSCKESRQPAATEALTVNPVIAVVDNGNVDFNTWFTDKTMRVDLFHSGTAEEEQFAVDHIVSDGPWPGSRKILIDPLQRGPYLFEVTEKVTGVLLYSRGFASIFGEWQTTPEADTWGTFHESVRFPWPLGAVSLIISKRDAQNVFRQIWHTDIDPSSRQVNPADMVHTGKVNVIADNGPAMEKLDIVILGDGYMQEEMQKFDSDARRLSEVLLGVEPFKSRNGDINIRTVEIPAPESGVTRPHPGVFKRTPLSVQYGAFDSERYALSFDNLTIRNVASAVPYDFMVILMNERTYGGGGIYNLYTTVSSDNNYSGYIMVHEMGHHMAALADEYYSSAVAYEIPEIIAEPWEPNITALFDKDNVKWKDRLEPATPIPTPWNKEAFDAYSYRVQKERDSLRAAKVPEEMMEALFHRQHMAEDSFFMQEKYRNMVGAFDGAGYVAKGLYRSQIDCIMFTRHMVFCNVCQRSISEVMDMYCNE